MKNIITYSNLYLEIPIHVLKIIKVEIVEELNEHGIAQIEIIADAEKELDIIDCLNSSIDIKVIADIQNKQKYLFIGCPTSVVIKHYHDVYFIKLKLKSKSFLLDRKRKSRSFQNCKDTYLELLKKIVKNKQVTIFENVSKGASQDKPVIQYEETDWELIKRITSKLKAKVITNSIDENPALWIGTQRGNEYSPDIFSYQVLQDLAWNSSISLKEEKRNLRYQFVSSVSYLLYDKIVYKNRIHTIIKKKGSLEHGIFLYTYELIIGTKVQQALLTNNKMIGASILGKVIAVSGRKVKLHLKIDREQELKEAFWYPYEINCSSEGKTGMYIMPTIGDYVELYFPKGKGEDAYARGCRMDYLEKEQSSSQKYLSNGTGQKISFSTDSIRIASENIPLFLNMTSQNGIEITANSDIHINTTESYMKGKKVAFYAGKQICLATDSASICIDKEIQIKAQNKVQI